MIDGSSESVDHTQEVDPAWNAWLNPGYGLDTTLGIQFDPPRHGSTFEAAGLSGGGSDSNLTGFDPGVSPDQLYFGNGDELGPSGQLSLLSGGQGHGMEA